MTRFQKLAIAMTAATFALIVAGALVRATGSGLGCPGWPRCFGRWIPPLQYHAVIEYSHRLLATVDIVLIGALAWMAIRHYRTVPKILWPCIAAVVLVFAQAALGAVVVRGELPAWLVTAHFATAMLLFGVVVNIATNSFSVSEDRRAETQDGKERASFARLAVVTAGAVYLLLLVGAYVRGREAGLAFPDWPLMDGRLVPALGGIATVQFLHRMLAAIVFLLVLYLVVRAWTIASRPRDLRILSALSLGLFVLQILAGAATVLTGKAPWAVVAHVALAALIWGVMVSLATLSSSPVESSNEQLARGEDRAKGGSSLRETTAAYFRLTKPRIIVLLLVTTIPAMVLAADAVPSPWLMIATLLGGTIAAGSANAINCYLDRDIDGVMRRTRRRPLPAHEMDPGSALTFGFVLGAVSFFFLGMTVNVLAAALALSAIAFYVFVYTLWLKRTTDQNIVIGGAAGAVPVLVGWAAVTGTVGLPALVLFAIVFVWTPPHFWALAMQYTGDYRAAGVPMLPVVRGHDETIRQIVLYSLVLFVTTLVLMPVAHMGAIYLAAAVGLGGVFVYRALKLWRRAEPALALGLFKYSIAYLALLFGAVALDRLVTIPV